MPRNYPDELMMPLLETDPASLQERSYETLSELLESHRKPMARLREWVLENGSPENWQEGFFAYLTLAAGAIQAKQESENRYRLSWPGMYDLEGVLRSWAAACIRKSAEKAETVRSFTRRLDGFIRGHRFPLYMLSEMIGVFTDSDISRDWGLEGEEERASGRFFLDTLLDLLTDCTDKIEGSSGLRELYECLIDLENGIDDLFDDDFEPMGKLFYFKLRVFYPGGYLQCDRYTREVMKRSASVTKELPEPDKLLDTGTELYGSHRAYAVLCFLLRYLLRSLDMVDGNTLKEHEKSGSNISNVWGIQAVEYSLRALAYYTAQSGMIAEYVAAHLTDDDACYALAKAVNNEYSSLFKYCDRAMEEGRVVEEMFMKIAGDSADGPGKIELRRLLVRRGRLSMEALPSKYRIKVPSALAADSIGLAKLFKDLKLSEAVTLKRKAKQVTEEWPDSVREIYLWKNGSDQWEFVPLKEGDEILQDIRNTLEGHQEWLEEDPDLDLEEGTVDIRSHIHDGIIPVGSSASGDMFFVDPRSRTETGHPVFRYCHDQVMTGVREADSLAEFLSKLFIERCIDYYGPDEELKKLLAL